MAGITYLQGTDHTTDFKQDSWKLISKNKCGNMFQFMGCWQKLKKACINGTIKDLLQCLAEEPISEERLGIGDFELCFSISMIHHRNCHSVNARKEIWNLLLKELDPDELVEDIKSIGIVGEKDIDELMDCMPREQRIGFLLGRLVELMGADEGFEMLLDYCRKYSYEHILNERKVLYTAKVILNIGKKEATEVNDNRNVPDSEYITSVQIQDSKSYFDTIVDDANVAEEIVMELIPVYDTTKDDPSVASIQIQSISKQKDELSVADMQKQLILKTADLLKEELDWPEIISISSSLNEDGYITDDKLEQIWDKSQPRREAIDMLLKVVLGNLSAVQAFMKILNSESHLLYLAERVNRTRLSADSVNRTTSSKRKRGKTAHGLQGSASGAVDKTVSSLGTDTVKQKLRSQVVPLHKGPELAKKNDL